MRNLGQSDFYVFANYTYAKIVIILTMRTDLFEHQYDVVMQLTRHMLKQLIFYGDVSFSHAFPLNCKTLAYLINKIL